MIKRSIAVLTLCIGAVFVGPLAAQASDSSNVIEPQNTPGTAADGWQSANCTSEEPVKCSPDTPNLYYKKAAGHPKFGFTQYIIQHEPKQELAPGVFVAPIKEPKEGKTIKTLRVELPPGLTVNPLATERCPLATFKEQKCGLEFPGSQVGYEEATLVTNEPDVTIPPLGLEHLPEGFVLPPIPGFTKVPVYGLIPANGEPALNGFIIAGSKEVFLETDVAWQSDYHESFMIKMPENEEETVPNPPFSTLISRQVSFGTAGNGTYITNPTTCFNPEEAPFEHAYSTFFRAESYEEPDPSFPANTSAIPTAFPEGLIPTGCMNVPFDPGLEVEAGTTAGRLARRGDGEDHPAVHPGRRRTGRVGNLRVAPAQRQDRSCRPGWA